MTRLALVVCAVVALCAAVPVLSVSLSEFDGTVSAFEEFTALLEVQQQHELDTNEHLSEDELALLEEGDNPSYTLGYPGGVPPFAAGGVVTPFSNVNPLAAPWAGFAPVAAPAVAASPMSAFYGGGIHPALGVNAALFPAAFAGAASDAQGGYNVHGLNAGNVFGGFHPGLSADLESLSGKAGAGGDAAAAGGDDAAAAGGDDAAAAGGDDAAAAGGDDAAAAFVEASTQSGAYPLASDSHDPANMEADASNVAYGMFPAPPPSTGSHYIRSVGTAQLGPHKLGFASVGSNEIDAAFPAFVEMEAEAAIDADLEAALADAAEADTETELIEVAQDPEGGDDAAAAGDDAAAGGDDAAAAGDDAAAGGDDAAAADGAAAGGDDAASANPSYTLPYPPVLPGHYTPLFNPYTNVNPLSTPFANYAATPGAHPGVAAAAAAQAGGLAAINSQFAGANGAYPYYPYAGGAVPFSGYAGWIHPQNLNQASVGDNADAASLGQFLEVTSTEETEHTGCVGCEY